MEFTKMMIKELVEYSILEAFIKDDEFAKFTVDEIKNTSWGQEVMFSEYWRDELFHEKLLEKDSSEFMCYYGSPFTPKIDEVDFLDKLVIIDFTLMGTVTCKTIVNVKDKSFRLIVDGREIITNGEFNESYLYRNTL